MRVVRRGVVGRIAGILKADPRNTLDVRNVPHKGGVWSFLTVTLHRKGRRVRKRKYCLGGGASVAFRKYLSFQLERERYGQGHAHVERIRVEGGLYEMDNTGC